MDSVVVTYRNRMVTRFAGNSSRNSEFIHHFGNLAKRAPPLRRHFLATDALSRKKTRLRRERATTTRLVRVVCDATAILSPPFGFFCASRVLLYRYLIHTMLIRFLDKNVSTNPTN